MSLITLSPADLQSKFNIQTLIKINSNYEQIVHIVNQMISTIWANPNGYTPQQVWNILGTNAVVVRNFYIQFIAGLNGTKVGSVVFSEPALTVNKDGTITIT